MFLSSFVFRVNDAQNRPRREYVPKPRPEFDYGDLEPSNGGYSPAAICPPAYSPGNFYTAYLLWERCEFFLNICICMCARPAPRRNTCKSNPSLRLMCLSFVTWTSSRTISWYFLPKKLRQEQATWVGRWRCHLTQNYLHSLCCTCVWQRCARLSVSTIALTLLKGICWVQCLPGSQNEMGLVSISIIIINCLTKL